MSKPFIITFDVGFENDLYRLHKLKPGTIVYHPTKFISNENCTNCKNCGAWLKTFICEYCGTNYNK